MFNSFVLHFSLSAHVLKAYGSQFVCLKAHGSQFVCSGNCQIQLLYPVIQCILKLIHM